MNEPELDKMESAFGIKFPLVYRSWALALPTAEEEGHWQWAFNDAEALIAANKDLREHGLCCMDWPPNLICIGYCGNVYTFFDSANPSAGVFSAHVGCDPYYEPDNYADCYQSSIEDFCKL